MTARNQNPNRPYHKTPSKRDTFVKKDERSVFVPRYLALQFLAIKGVTDVKPGMNTPERIEIFLIVNQPYNHKLQVEILQVEHSIKEALRSRQQTFQASISW